MSFVNQSAGTDGDRLPVIPSPAVPRSRMPESRAGLVAVSGAVYYSAAVLGLALRLPGNGVSAVWPANGALTALLLLTPMRQWPWLLLPILPAHFAALWDAGFPWWRLLWQVGHNVALTVAIGSMLRAWLSERSPFGSLRDAFVYVAVAVVVAPALVACVAPHTILTALAPNAGPVWWAWRSTALSNSLALLALTPALYTWLQQSTATARWRQPFAYLEAALLSGVMYLTYVVIFPDSSHHSPLYLVFPCLLWAAARFGMAGATLAISVIVIVTASVRVLPHTLLISEAPAAGVVDLQVFLIAASVTTLVLAVVMEERQRSSQALHNSEARYRAIVESQTELVCRSLPDTTLTFVNEAYCRFFGRPREQLLGRKWLELLPQAVRSAVHERLARVTPVSPILVHEHEVLLPEGAVGWHQWIDVGLFDRRGRLVEVQGIGRDITQLKRVEQSLRQSDERFRLVLQATNDIIYDWDVQRDVVWSSADGGACDPGRTQSSWTVERWTQAIHEDDRERVLRSLREALQGTEQVWEAEYRYARDGVSTRYVYERGYVLRDANGKPVRMIGSLADITDRKRLQEANHSLARIARLATLGEITASIAHEINQPLGAIQNNAETALLLLRSGRFSTEELECVLEDIRSDNRRASDVITRLRELLLNQQVPRRSVDLYETLNGVLELLRAEARRRRVLIEVRCECRAIVEADRTQLQQVMLNLLLNSLDAVTAAPEARRCILVRTACGDDRNVLVSVVDRGGGIAPERLPHIFDSFVTTKPQGMGLGLAIARSIIEAHDGRIWAENNADGGASIHFELPLSGAHAASADE